MRVQIFHWNMELQVFKFVMKKKPSSGQIKRQRFWSVSF